MHAKAGCTSAYPSAKEDRVTDVEEAMRELQKDVERFDKLPPGTVLPGSVIKINECVRTVLAALEEAQKDTRRLDYLERNQHHKVKPAQLDQSHVPSDLTMYAIAGSPELGLRAILDAAMILELH
jgi:hypothetical protein